MPETTKRTQRAVIQFGEQSRLLLGDKDQGTYGSGALPRLLEEGWVIVQLTPTSAPSGAAPAVLFILEKNIAG